MKEPLLELQNKNNLKNPGFGILGLACQLHIWKMHKRTSYDYDFTQFFSATKVVSFGYSIYTSQQRFRITCSKIRSHIKWVLILQLDNRLQLIFPKKQMKHNSSHKANSVVSWFLWAVLADGISSIPSALAECQLFISICLFLISTLGTIYSNCSSQSNNYCKIPFVVKFNVYLLNNNLQITGFFFPAARYRDNSN